MGLLKKFLGIFKSKQQPAGDEVRVVDISSDANLAMLIQKPDVQQALGMLPDQIQKTTQLIGRVRRQHRERFQAIAQLPPQKQQRARKRFKNELGKEAIQNIDAAGILTKDQRHRLQQIGWQMRGPRAFLDGSLRKLLRLTNQQEQPIMKSLNEIAGLMRNELSPGDRDASSNDATHDDVKNKIGEQRDEVLVKILGLLSDDQKRVWHDVVGESFSAGGKIEAESPNT